MRKFANCVRSAMVAVISIWAVYFMTAEVRGSEVCMECHDSLHQEEMKRQHVHPPFRFKKCEICHAAEAGWTTDEESNAMAKKLRWLARQMTAAQEHWCDFSIAGLEKVLFVEARNGKQVNRKKIALPELPNLPRLQDDRKPPRITGLKLENMEIGLFATATLAWNTDELATSVLRYGVDRRFETSADTTDLSHEHRITLTGLKPNRIYSVQALSRDVHGNDNASDTILISTKTSYSDPGKAMPQKLAAGDSKLEVVHELFRVNDRYLLHVTANQPIKISVGALPMVAHKNGQVKSEVSAGEMPDDHVRLKSQVETTIYVCYDCHSDYNKISTHPVGVGPKRGMVIPAEYPTLPDGRITCRSCHASHAHDQEFMLLKSSKRELCIGCHRDMA